MTEAQAIKLLDIIQKYRDNFWSSMLKAMDNLGDDPTKEQKDGLQQDLLAEVRMLGQELKEYIESLIVK
jgi:hypothetical protein